MKMLLALVLFVLVVAVAYAQTEFMVQCDKGICLIKESDLMKLQNVINALVDRVEQLQARSGCS